MTYAPIARIALRYVVGGVIMGSDKIGDRLAADPDLVAVAALLIAAGVEGGYALAKSRGWAT